MGLYQVVAVELERDNAAIRIRLADESEYQISQPFYARAVRAKIPPSGELTAEQYRWLQKYRVAVVPSRRDRLLSICHQLRAELKGEAKHGENVVCRAR